MSAFSDQAVAYENVFSAGPSSADADRPRPALTSDEDFASNEPMPDLSSDEEVGFDPLLPNPDDLLGEDDFVALSSDPPPAAAVTAPVGNPPPSAGAASVEPVGYFAPPPASLSILEKGGIVPKQRKKTGRKPKPRPNLSNAAVHNAFTLARAAIHEDRWLQARVSYLEDKVCQRGVGL
jgi:hypothetical protein